jgi:hypothetical protein
MEVEGIRAEIQGMSDYDLIDEVAALEGYDEAEDRVDEIFVRYIKQGKLTEEEREELIWYYVLVNIEDYLVIDEVEEW